MIGVMALIVLPIFMIVSAQNLSASEDYAKNHIKHVGRYFTLITAWIIIAIDIIIVATWLGWF